MVVKCAVCGKRTVILYPHLWAYKRDKKYFCSYSCKRIFDKGEIDMKEEKTSKRNRLELGQKVLELISAGKSPIPYLAGIGYANPQMAYADIKKACIKNDPSLADKFPESIRGLKKPVEIPEGNATVVATKEPPRPIAGGEWEKMVMPEAPLTVSAAAIQAKMEIQEEPDASFDDECEVAAIRVPDMGEFYFDQKFNSIDWRYEGEEISMHPLAWKRLAEILPKVFEKLGVEM